MCFPYGSTGSFTWQGISYCTWGTKHSFQFPSKPFHGGWREEAAQMNNPPSVALKRPKVLVAKHGQWTTFQRDCFVGSKSVPFFSSKKSVCNHTAASDISSYFMYYRKSVEFPRWQTGVQIGTDCKGCKYPQGNITTWQTLIWLTDKF